MILDSATVDADVTLDADVCVVGSGAGGAVAACELAEAGHTVVLVEDGSYLRGEDYVQREEVMYPRLYREGGTKATADYTVLVSQGRAVGGSTAPSFCLCVRPPRPLLALLGDASSVSPVSSTRRCTRSFARSRSGSGRSASRPSR